MYCSNCGQMASGKFCSNCGATLSGEEKRGVDDFLHDEPAQTPPKKTNVFMNSLQSLADKASEKYEHSKALKQEANDQAKIEKMVNKKMKTACCPKCGSTSLSAHKKGFGIGKAVVGAALTGGIGLISGNIGAKKVRVTCLNCGKQFWAGKGK